MSDTHHARLRAQQRAIPPIVDRLLDEFGEEEHDGRGGVHRFFSHRGFRKMAQALGQQPAELFKRYRPAYRVDSSRDGKVITRGWQTKRLKRGG